MNTQFLTAQTSTLTSFMIAGRDLEFLSRQWESLNIKISSIAAHVGFREKEPGYEKLKEEIVQSGMKYPIVLLENTFENYVGCCQNVRPDCILPHDPSRIWIAAAGNQRLQIAREENFFSISAIIAPDLGWAFSILSEIRQRED